MSWTKGQFIDEAFSEAGLSSYAYDLTADERQSALRRLDSMMAQWNSQGIRIGYPLPESPGDSKIGDKTNVPDESNEAIFLNLSIRLAPMFGKQVNPVTMATAKKAYDMLLRAAQSIIPQLQYPHTLPRGAGAKPWRQSLNSDYFPQPKDNLTAGPDGPLTFT